MYKRQGATILSLVKMGQSTAEFTPQDMILGNMGGSMGEVSAVAILIGLVYLLVTKVVSWHIPGAILLGLAFIDIMAGYPVGIDIVSGGFLLGAVFMATDYVTSPMTKRGMLFYGFMIGVITASIRRWGIYPEGMSFAILIMNGATPLINRHMRPSRFSPRQRKEVAV